MANDATAAPARATEQVDSPAASPAAAVDTHHAPWVGLVKAGATRICQLMADALDDDACDRADSILFFMKRSDDAALWNDGPYAVALLRAAADTLALGRPSADVAIAVRPAAIALLGELATGVDALQSTGDMARLAAFADFKINERENQGGPTQSAAIQTGVELPASAAWADFVQVYRQHLGWLLAQGANEADNVSDGAKMAAVLARSAGRSAATRSFVNQSESVGDMADLFETIGEAVKTAGDDQDWLWDRAIAMAYDFSDAACGIVENASVGGKHVRYLADYAQAQEMLLRILSSNSERWEADRPEQPAPEAQMNGFTPWKIQTTLQEIGCCASTLRDFLVDLRSKNERDGTSRVAVSNDLHMAQQSVCLIGAMADHLTGGVYIGSAASWATMDGIEAAKDVQ